MFGLLIINKIMDLSDSRSGLPLDFHSDLPSDFHSVFLSDFRIASSLSALARAFRVTALDLRVTSSQRLCAEALKSEHLRGRAVALILE